MKIKRFFAKDMRTALQDVKNELGVDAVIMSNTKTADGIEIVAAVDDNNDAAVQPNQQPNVAQSARNPSGVRHGNSANVNESSNFRQENDYSQQLNARFEQESASESQDLTDDEVADSLKALLQRQNAKAKEQVQIAAEALKKQPTTKRFQRAFEPEPKQTHSEPNLFERFNSQSPQKDETANQHNTAGEDLLALKQEMAEMRKLMQHQVSGLMWQEMARREPMRAYLVDQLNKLGIANEVADQVASFIPEELEQQEAWENALELLAGQINTTNNDILRRGGFVALLGPTGVGKTTTIAKLAAHFAQQHGSDQVAMVTTDSFRIGAHEQLQTYARILGCPCKLVHNQEELAETLYQLRNRKLVLIDTAGVGQRDMNLAAHLDTLMTASAVKIRSYLVLQATAQRRVMQEAIERFKQIPLTGCIFSKLDECMSIGELISVAIQNALPIGYLSEGQRVPEDLRVAESEYLVLKAAQLMNERNISQPNWFTDDSLQPINK